MTNSEHQRTMRIHIDRVPLGSPDPTTGNALYRLGAVADHSDLFREVLFNYSWLHGKLSAFPLENLLADFQAIRIIKTNWHTHI